MTSHSDGPVRKKKLPSTSNGTSMPCPRPLLPNPIHLPILHIRTTPSASAVEPARSTIHEPTSPAYLPKAPSPSSRSHLSGPVRRVLVELIRRSGPRFFAFVVSADVAAAPVWTAWLPAAQHPQQTIKAAFWLFGPYACLRPAVAESPAPSSFGFWHHFKFSAQRGHGCRRFVRDS